VRNWLWENCSSVVHLGARPEHRFLAANLTFVQSLQLHLLNGRVVLRPDLLSFTETGLEFVDRTLEGPIDDVIFCTGFEFDFSIVEQGSLVRVRYNDFHLYKHMFLPDLCEHNNLAVIGNVQPTGPSFPVAEMQARLFFHVLSGRASLPSQFDMKASLERRRCDMSLDYVKTRRHTQIEDFVDYLDSLADVIGARPDFTRLLKKDTMLAIKAYIGPLSASQYRLQGVHEWAEARDVVMGAWTPNRSELLTLLLRALATVLVLFLLVRTI